MICKILCVFDVKWTIWFVRPDFIFYGRSKRLKQKNFILISWKFIHDFFMFGKKKTRFANFIKSQSFTCNFQPIHPVIKKTRWNIWFKFNIIISFYNVFKQSAVVQSMNAFNIWISPKNKWSACDHFHFLLFCFFCNCTGHCNHASQSTVNSYHQRFRIFMFYLFNGFVELINLLLNGLFFFRHFLRIHKINILIYIDFLLFRKFIFTLHNIDCCKVALHNDWCAN